LLELLELLDELELEELGLTVLENETAVLAIPLTLGLGLEQ